MLLKNMKGCGGSMAYKVMCVVNVEGNVGLVASKIREEYEKVKRKFSPPLDMFIYKNMLIIRSKEGANEEWFEDIVRKAVKVYASAPVKELYVCTEI